MALGLLFRKRPNGERRSSKSVRISSRAMNDDGRSRLWS